jgi:hypothetical protein
VPGCEEEEEGPWGCEEEEVGPWCGGWEEVDEGCALVAGFEGWTELAARSEGGGGRPLLTLREAERRRGGTDADSF